ncbi:MAG: D-alanyl-D-alanine carboxypeptidase [Actinomycetota bacterium]|nr:D-alanyl-D-alanine carboxypeptidase [Actinomycetota bacterium]
MHHKRVVLVASVAIALQLLFVSTASARPLWKKKIDREIGNHSVSVAIADGARALYRHDPRTQHIPASNEKLLLSMALLDRFGSSFRLPTTVLGARPSSGVVQGNVWIVGRGDPTVTGGGAFGRSLPFKPTGLRKLARRIKQAGVNVITGRVIGVTSYFSHDWFAPGWKADFPAEEVALPSAVAIDGNTHKGRHISNPEFRAAKKLTVKLKRIGVLVADPPKAGARPHNKPHLAHVMSQPLTVLMRYMDRQSSNFFAEELGKRLSVETYGVPGTIAHGAGAIKAWAARHGVPITAYDSSGLSYDNRVSPSGIVSLLAYSTNQPWGPTLRSDLAGGGEGTLEDRLKDVKIRAKTGTLDNISALSGWLWSRPLGRWIEFSILSGGMPKYQAAAIEDRIVRIAAHHAH